MWPNPQETIKDFFIFCAVSLRHPDSVNFGSLLSKYSKIFN